MGDTARNLGRTLRSMSSGGGRNSRIGVILIVLGAVLLVAALIGAALVNL